MGRNQNTHPWTNEQINILKKYYPKGGTEEVLKHLKGRTSISIKVKCQRLGIKTNIQGFRTRDSVWTEREIKILKKWYPIIGYRTSEVRKVIGTPYLLDLIPNRGKSSIQNKVRRLELIYNPQINVPKGEIRCNLCVKIKKKEKFNNWVIKKELNFCRDCEKKVHEERYNNLEYRLIKSLKGFLRSNKVKSPSTKDLRKIVISLLDKYEYECFFKDKHCDMVGRLGPTIGHKTPISFGGDLINEDNLFFLCMGHNMLMSSLRYDQFIPSLKSMNKKLEKYFSSTN